MNHWKTIGLMTAGTIIGLICVNSSDPFLAIGGAILAAGSLYYGINTLWRRAAPVKAVNDNENQ